MSDTHVAEQPVVDVLRVATEGGARELLRVVMGEAPGAAGGCAEESVRSTAFELHSLVIEKKLPPTALCAGL